MKDPNDPIDTNKDGSTDPIHDRHIAEPAIMAQAMENPTDFPTRPTRQSVKEPPLEIPIASPRKLSEKFAFSSATFIGSSHFGLRGNTLGIPNQDSISRGLAETTDGKQTLIFCVSDGCSDAPKSHIGSHSLANWFTSTAAALEKDSVERTIEDLLETVRLDLLKNMEFYAKSQVIAGEPWQILAEQFLATLVVAVIREDRWAIATIGDGMYGVNGNVTSIPSYEDNAPPYLAYSLMPDDMRVKGEYKFEVRESGKTASLNSLLIASDGLSELKADYKSGTPSLEDLMTQSWVADSTKIPSWLKGCQSQFSKVKATQPTGVSMEVNVKFETEIPRFSDDVSLHCIVRLHEIVTPKPGWLSPSALAGTPSVQRPINETYVPPAVDDSRRTNKASRKSQIEDLSLARSKRQDPLNPLRPVDPVDPVDKYKLGKKPKGNIFARLWSWINGNW